MTAFTWPGALNPTPERSNAATQAALLQGEVLLQTRPHSAWGGAVTARMYVPLERSQVWQQLVDYPRWTQYFPDVTHSEVLTSKEQSATPTGPSSRPRSPLTYRQLYQAARKNFVLFTVQVEVHLNVVELANQAIQFRLASGSFSDFSADLDLQDWHNGTLLTYAVQATPTIPVPALLIEQAMKLDLPNNLRQMRQAFVMG